MLLFWMLEVSVWTYRRFRVTRRCVKVECSRSRMNGSCLYLSVWDAEVLTAGKVAAKEEMKKNKTSFQDFGKHPIPLCSYVWQLLARSQGRGTLSAACSSLHVVKVQYESAVISVCTSRPRFTPRGSRSFMIWIFLAVFSSLTCTEDQMEAGFTVQLLCASSFKGDSIN